MIPEEPNFPQKGNFKYHMTTVKNKVYGEKITNPPPTTWTVKHFYWANCFTLLNLNFCHGFPRIAWFMVKESTTRHFLFTVRIRDKHLCCQFKLHSLLFSVLKFIQHLNPFYKLDLSVMMRKEIRFSLLHCYNQCQPTQNFILEWLNHWSLSKIIERSEQAWRAGCYINWTCHVSHLKNLRWANYSWEHVFINDPLKSAFIKTRWWQEEMFSVGVDNSVQKDIKNTCT